MKGINAVPVLYYHSVAKIQSKVWGFLSIERSMFLLHIKFLKFRGYETCTWPELYDHMSGNKELPRKTVMLQFDDGFLDNWSVVYPIIKEYSIKISIVVSQDFVDKTQGLIRPFISKPTENNLKDWWGYISEAEIKEMANSGLVDFQAHGKTHTWYESQPVLEDVYDGSQIIPHLYWNIHPKEKAQWLSSNLESKIPKGYPIFTYGKSLEIDKRYILNKDFIQECILSYDSEKTEEQNIENAKNIFSKYQDLEKLGRIELEAEKDMRIEEELVGNRTYLENLLGKKVEFIVFPGGGISEQIILKAKKYGYKQASKGKKLNVYNCKHEQILRQSATYPFKLGGLNGLLSLLFFNFQIKRGEGNKFMIYLIAFFRKIKGLE